MSLDCLVIGPKEIAAEERSLFRASHPACQIIDRLNFIPHEGREYLPLDLLSSLRADGARMDPQRHFRGSYLTVNEIPALAPMVLVTHLARAGFRATAIHYFDAERELLERELSGGRVGCVAVTTTLYTDPAPIRQVVRSVRSANPDVPIVVGGPYVLNRWNRDGASGLESDARLIGADYYVVDPAGEDQLASVLHQIRCGVSAPIPGVAVPVDGGLEFEPNRTDPSPVRGCGVDWSLFDRSVLGATVNFRTARGCAFSCAYCNYPVLAGRISLAEVETLEKELQQLARHSDVRFVAFIDDTFNIPARRFQEICRMLARNSFPFRWVSYLRVNAVDEETVLLMAESGCVGVFLGLESGDDEVLVHMNKKATVSEYQRGVELLRKHDIIAFGTFICGFPGESEASLRATARFIRDVGLDYYRVGLWFADTATPVFRRRGEFAIEGSGYAWRHRSLDSVTAAQAIWSEFFEDERNPTWLTEHIGFWGLTYLLGKGFSRQQIDVVLQSVRSLMLDGVGARSLSPTGRERELDRMREVARAVPFDGLNWAGREATSSAQTSAEGPS